MSQPGAGGGAPPARRPGVWCVTLAQEGRRNRCDRCRDDLEPGELMVYRRQRGSNRGEVRCALCAVEDPGRDQVHGTVGDEALAACRRRREGTQAFADVVQGGGTFRDAVTARREARGELNWETMLETAQRASAEAWEAVTAASYALDEALRRYAFARAHEERVRRAASDG